MGRSEFNYEIVERISTLSKNGDTTKELNRVSYNGAPPKYDIRQWRRSEEGGEKMLKGVTLTAEEFEALKDAIAKLPH